MEDIDQEHDVKHESGGKPRRLLLIEFAVRHGDFQYAELESVLRMHTLQQQRGDGFHNEDSMIIDSIAWCNEDLPNFGKEETCDEKRPVFRPFCLISIILSRQQRERIRPEEVGESDEGLYNTRELDDDEDKRMTQMFSRCTLVRSVIELWGKGTSLDDCIENVTKFLSVGQRGYDFLKRRRKQWLANDTTADVESKHNASWKLSIHTLGTKIARGDHDVMRQAMLERTGMLKLLADRPVQMQNPKDEFILLTEVELDRQGSAIWPHKSPNGDLIDANIHRPPLAVYFGRIIGERLQKGRGEVDKYTLKKRSYLGPTSMDAELSFIMTNLAHVRKSSMVLDPFVGTGSILISCALRGAYCVGTDIDLRVLRGRSMDENIRSNFAQYGLPPPELVRSDNALYGRHYRTNVPNEPLYDAIVTDPPYGIRAGARQTGSRKDAPQVVLEEHRHDHIAQTKPYPVADVMADLLDVAAQTLVLETGRLVFVIPSYATNFSPEDDLPRHVCLELEHVCYQPFTLELGRRMVSMRRNSVVYRPEDRSTVYRLFTWKNGEESAEKCANIRAKILEAAKLKPNYEARLAVRKQKRKATKEARKRAKQQQKQQQA